MSSILYSSRKMAIEIFENYPSGRQKLLTLFDKPIQNVDKDVETIRNWLKKQPHLPEVPGDRVIERFLIMSKFYVETAKSKLDMYFTVKCLIPEFYNQHPCSEAAKAVEKVVFIVPLPFLNQQLSRIMCWKLKDTNPDKFDPIAVLSYTLSIIEIRLREDTCSTDTFICDLNGLTLSHLAKFTPVLLKKVNFLVEKVFALRSSVVYIINAPTFIDMFISILSKHFKPKLIERIKVCGNLNELHKGVPQNDLPKDFNGSLKCLQEYQDMWIEKFKQSAPLFDHLMSLRVDEKLRPGKPLVSEVLGIQGHFRQLNID